MTNTLVFVPQDDIIDDVDSFVAAAETLKERGAYKIFVMATHGILSSEAPRFIEESAIDEVSVRLENGNDETSLADHSRLLVLTSEHI